MLNIDPIDTNDRDCRFKMADVEITDEETYDEPIIVRTHLGDKLREGCVVLCYDRRVSCLPDAVDNVFKKRNLPDVIVVGRAHDKKRSYKVRELAPHNSDDEAEFQGFMTDLAEDSELRQDVTIYKGDTEEVVTESDLVAAAAEDDEE